MSAKAAIRIKMLIIFPSKKLFFRLESSSVAGIPLTSKGNDCGCNILLRSCKSIKDIAIKQASLQQVPELEDLHYAPDFDRLTWSGTAFHAYSIRSGPALFGVSWRLPDKPVGDRSLSFFFMTFTHRGRLEQKEKEVLNG